MNRREQRKLARKVRWPMIAVCVVFLGLLVISSVTVNDVRFVMPDWIDYIIAIGIIFMAYAIGWYCGALGHGLSPITIRVKVKKKQGETATHPMGLRVKKLGQKE